MSGIQHWSISAGRTPDDRNRRLQACAHLQHTGFLLPGLAPMPVRGHYAFRGIQPHLRPVCARQGDSLAHRCLSKPGAVFRRRPLAHCLQLIEGGTVPHSRLHIIGRAISAGIIACTAIVSLIVIRQVAANPRTDDAEVFANFIGMAPLVNGPIMRLYIADSCRDP